MATKSSSVKRRLLLTSIAGLLFCGCSAHADSVVTRGFSALANAYASDVKPSDAAFTQCTTGAVQSRHVAVCGISYGAETLAQVGVWEVVPANGQFAVYAMNGKALQALGKMTRAGSLTAVAYPGVFNAGNTRPVLDIVDVKAQILKK